MDLGLQGKNALITGGSIGIGEAIALALAQEGVRVGICSRDLERGEASAAAAAAESDGTVRAFQAEVSKESDINRLASEVTESLGSVDILINNAGTGSEETIIDAPDAKWQYYWDLHVMAAVRLSRALVPGMRGRDGVIINNASICARQPLYYEPIYNTTKAALVMMTKCLANELIQDKIRVNSVNPGLVRTPDWEKTAAILGPKEGITAEAYLDRIAKEHTPIGRFATPDEIARFFVFLASPAASYSVGSTYYVDGGWLNVAG